VTCGRADPGQDPDGEGRWVPLAPLAAGPRQELPAVELGGQIYAIGGFDALSRTVATVEAFDPQQNRWRRVADVPQPMNHANAAAVLGKIYVVGYLDAGFRGVGRVFEYDPASDLWTERTPMPAGTERGASGTAVVDGRIYVVGGSRGRAVADASVYSPVSDSWTVLPPLPTARDHLAAAAIGRVVYAASGRNGPNTAALEAFNTETRVWTPRAPIPTARGGIAAAAFEGRLYVFGGEGNAAEPSGVFSQTEVYDPATDRWEALAPMRTPRHGIGAAVLGERIYVPGGATRQGFGAVAAHEAFVPSGVVRVSSLAWGHGSGLRR
jgi:N-acetylneuraminic acid mutarotase